MFLIDIIENTCILFNFSHYWECIHAAMATIHYVMPTMPHNAMTAIVTATLLRPRFKTMLGTNSLFWVLMSFSMWCIAKISGPKSSWEVRTRYAWYHYHANSKELSERVNGSPWNGCEAGVAGIFGECKVGIDQALHKSMVRMTYVKQFVNQELLAYVEPARYTILRPKEFIKHRKKVFSIISYSKKEKILVEEFFLRGLRCNC